MCQVGRLTTPRLLPLAAVVAAFLLAEGTANAQVPCPALLQETSVTGTNSGFSTTAAQANIVWTTEQQITLPGGWSAGGLYMELGDDPPVGVEVGLAVGKFGETETKMWYVRCKTANCIYQGNNFIDYTWSQDTDYRVYVWRDSAASCSQLCYRWNAVLLLNSGGWTPVTDPIQILVASTHSTAEVVGLYGLQQRVSNGPFNSIGHHELVGAYWTGSFWRGVRGASQSEDQGYWIEECGATIKTFNTGTNEDCLGVGTGLAPGCY